MRDLNTAPHRHTHALSKAPKARPIPAWGKASLGERSPSNAPLHLHPGARPPARPGEAAASSAGIRACPGSVACGEGTSTRHRAEDLRMTMLYLAPTGGHPQVFKNEGDQAHHSISRIPFPFLRQLRELRPRPHAPASPASAKPGFHHLDRGKPMGELFPVPASAPLLP